MSEHNTSYLHTVTITDKLRNSFVGRYLKNFRVVSLIIGIIAIAGINAYNTLPRRLNPEVKIPIVTVSTVLPGASAQNIEQLITVPLEDKLNGIDKLDSITSTSSENVSIIVMQFLSTASADKARDDAQSLVDQVKLPTDSERAVVKKVDFEGDPVWQFALTATATNEASLYTYATELKKKLKDLPQIDTVNVGGLPNDQLQIIIDPIKSTNYGLSAFGVASSIKEATGSYPAGSLQTNNGSFALSIEKSVFNAQTLRDLRISVKGSSIKLGDIATVSEAPKVGRGKNYIASGKTPAGPTVTFDVYKTTSSNIDKAGKASEELVKEELKKHPTFTLTTITNTAERIQKDFDDLFSEFRSTVILIFIVLLLFLGLRQAVISSLTVPLTFLSSFVIIQSLGLTLNFLTTFSFLISLGLLIDDTIVAVSAMTTYYRSGKFTPWETGLLVWKDFIIPIWSTTITTLWAFLPLLLSTGIIGEFIKSIPIVVGATLISSTAISVLITIPLMIIFLKPALPSRIIVFLQLLGLITVVGIFAALVPNSPVKPLAIIMFIILLSVIYVIRATIASIYTKIIARFTGKKWFTFITNGVNDGVLNIEALSFHYRNIISSILGNRAKMRLTLGIIVTFFLFCLLLVPLGFVKNEFFPKTDENTVYINLEFPSGTAQSATEKESLALLESLRNNKYVDTAVLQTGANFSGDSSGGGSAGATNLSFITLNLVDKKLRDKTSIDIAEDLRASAKNFTKGILRVTETSNGPPAGADISLTVLGDDLKQIGIYTGQLKEFLQKQPGITNVELSVKEGSGKIAFIPNYDELIKKDITTTQIAGTLRSFASGITADTIKIDNEDKDIVIINSLTLQNPEDIAKLTIKTDNGNVPLLSLGKLELQNNPSVIRRSDGKRAISVIASVKKGFNVGEQNKALEDFSKTLNLQSGYSFKTGGVNDENEKSVQSILQAMILSAVLILTTMVIQFKSFRQAIITLMLIPLATSGVFLMFAITATPLSFPALIGILALFGIVVTTGIVVIEKINQNRASGLLLKESIVDAAQSRLEPVLLTSIATICGLLPITIADPLWRGLGGAIISGLLFSGAIKLFFVPVVYYSWFKTKEN
jgi:multidrug efflux pump subunit AcrB